MGTKKLILLVLVALTTSHCQKGNTQREFEKQKFQMSASKTLVRFAEQLNHIRRGVGSSTAVAHQVGATTVETVRSAHLGGGGFTLHSSLRAHAESCLAQVREIPERADTYSLSMLVLAVCLNQDLNRSAVMPYAYGNMDSRNRAYYMYLNSFGQVPVNELSSRGQYSNAFDGFVGSGGWPTQDLLFGP